MTNKQLADYVQAGMGGSVPRPEIGGRDLRDLLHWIRSESLQGVQEKVDLQAIEDDLAAAGYYGPKGPSDARSPEIRNVNIASIDSTTARITWQTDKPTLGVIHFGVTDYYGRFSAVESIFGKNHSATLSGLARNRTHHLRIVVEDEASNKTFTRDLTFENGTPDKIPPVISGVSAVPGSKSAVITWTTDEDANAQVEYGKTTAYGSQTTLDQALVKSHRVTVTGLAYETLYHFRVKNRDDSGNLTVSGDFTFTTLPKDTRAPIISEFKIKDVTSWKEATALFKTDEPAFSHVDVSTDQKTWVSTKDNTSPAQDFSITVTGLSEQTHYYARAVAKDDDDNVTISSALEFTTLSRTTKSDMAGWSFDASERQGLTIKDPYGGNHGIVSLGNAGNKDPALAFVPGVRGDALKLDGTDDLMSVPNDPEELFLNLPNNGASISTWINTEKLTASTGPVYTGILGRPAHGNWQAEGNYALGIYQAGTAAESNFYVEVGSQNDVDRLDAKAKITKNKWYFVTLTWDAKTLSLYINGVLDSARARTKTINYTVDNPFIAGLAPGRPFVEYRLTGSVDETCLFRKTLTPEEIQKLFNGGSGNPCGSILTTRIDIPGGSSQKGAEGVPFSSMVMATVVPSSPITLTASGLPAGAAFTDQGGGLGLLDWLPNFTQAGIYTVTFTAASGTQSVSTTLGIEILNTTDAPVFSIRLPETTTSANQTASISLTALDPEGDRVIFTLADSRSYASGAATLTDRGDGTATISFTPDKAGYHYLLVTLTDPSGNSRTVPILFRVGTLIRSAKSGPWSSPNTWDLGVVPTASHRVLIEHHTVTLDTQAEAVEVIVQHHGMLHVSRQVSSSLRLTGSLAVLHGGHLEAGTAVDPIPAGITTEILFTVPSDAIVKGNSPYLPGPKPGMPDMKGDIGLWVMDEGSYATLHGAPIQNPWVRLLADTHPGGNQLEVDTSVADWPAGSQILITSWDNPDWIEIRRVDSIQGNRITLDSPASHFHPGRRYAYHKTTQALRLLGAAESPSTNEVLVRNQCEVALLTRNLTIASDMTKGNGKAHTLAMMGGRYSVAYTQLKDMGPKQEKGPFGRYPLHLHRVGEAQGLAFTGNALWNSGTSGHQGIVLHDTNGARVEGNLVYNVQGPPIDMERATETTNTIQKNLLVKFAAPDPTPQEDLARRFSYVVGFTAGLWVRSDNTVTDDNVIVFGQAGAAGLGITPSTLSPAPGAATILGNTLRANSLGLAFFGSELSAEFKDGVLAANTRGLTTSPAPFNGLRNSILIDNQDQPASDAEYKTREPDLTPIGNTYVKLPCLKGDTDGSGAVTLADATKLIRILLGADPAPDPGTTAFCRADCNADGSLTLADVTCIIRKLLG